jgi:outer membrane protein OmpA-like peptidoglycan-associated protein
MDKTMSFSIEPAPSPVFSSRWIPAAFILSLLFHLILGASLGWIHLQPFAIPYQKKKMEHPLQVKRVEINPALFSGTEQSPASLSSEAIDLHPNPQLTPNNHALAEELQESKPATFASPSSSVSIVESEAASASPYTFSNTAALRAQMTQLSAEPVSSSALILGHAASAEETKTGGNPSPGSSGASLPGSGDNSLPSFKDISVAFKGPQAGLNPHLPEPILLRLPSDVIFDFNSIDLRPEAFPLLDKAARLIEKYPHARIQVDGHTDTIGLDSYNQKLSEDRARTVEKWLEDHLEKNNFSFNIHGYGKTRPLVNPKGNKDQQQRNRRVEIIIQAISN